MTNKIYGLNPWKDNDFKELRRFKKMLYLCLDDKNVILKIKRKLKRRKYGSSDDEKKMEYYNGKS